MHKALCTSTKSQYTSIKQSFLERQYHFQIYRMPINISISQKYTRRLHSAYRKSSKWVNKNRRK